jgi:flagellar hook-associated protein 3 FlgL
MPNTDMQYRLRRQEQGLAAIQSKLGGDGSRIRELREDPMAASHAIRYESYLARLERYEKNAQYAMDHYDTLDSYLKEYNEILQRIRELAVKGGTGTISPDESKYIAVEVNELLKELVAIANKTGQDGKQVFAGDKAFTEPFRLVEGSVEGGGESMVVRVEYRGAGANRRTEISDGSYTTLDIGGGEAFWAERMNVISRVDATDYRVNEAASIFVDGVEIQLNTGDTVAAVAARINQSTAPVKAYIDPETHGLALTGTTPHLIRMEDRQGSTVLRDLGIIRVTNDPSAPNWNDSALVSGGSAFDMVIRLRDALFRHDQEYTGSQGLGGIDLALTNIQSHLTVEGSRKERSEMTKNRVNEEIANVTADLAREKSLDYTNAATELALMDFAHRAALQTAAKIIPPTLLDFLR